MRGRKLYFYEEEEEEEMEMVVVEEQNEYTTIRKDTTRVDCIIPFI